MRPTALLSCARAAACGLALSACALLQTPAPRSEPAAPPPAQTPQPEPEPAPQPPARAYGAEERERAALRYEAKGDLARALVQWKLLRLLEPESPEWPKRVSDLRHRIDEKAAALVGAGETASKSGDDRGAREAFLQALALKPGEKEAARRLREIEAREIQLREQAKLAPKGKSADRSAAARPADNQASYYLETGVELYRQGDYEKSLVEFDKYLGAFPDDQRARKYLAEARVRLGEAQLKSGDVKGAIRHFEAARKSGGADGRQLTAQLQQAKHKAAEELYDLGVKASRSDLDKAIDYWRECLAYEPEHVGARVQLDKAVKMRERLKTVR